MECRRDAARRRRRWLPVVLGLLLAPALAAQPYTRQIDAVSVLDAGGTAYTHPWLGGLNVPRPHFVDIDADGDLDLFVQERNGSLIFFENTGSDTTPQFTWRTDAFAGLDVGEWARFADLDNDGDLDVLAEQPFSFVRMYRNVGTAADARYELAVDSLRDIDGTYLFSDRQNLPALADIDCDGLLDLFIPSLSGFLTYYANLGVDSDGLPRFHFVTDRYQDLAIIGGLGKEGRKTPGLALHGAAAITFVDFDEDGDKDLFWGDFFSPSLYFIENSGTCETPMLALKSDLFPFDDPIQTRGYNVPAFADIDGDGDADLFAGVVGGAFGDEQHPADNFYFFRHDDEQTFSLQSRQYISSLDVDQESMPAFADFDADGDLDLVVGNRIDPAGTQTANLFYFRNEGTSRAPAFRLVGDLLEGLDADRLFNIAPAVADLDGDGDLDMLLGGFDGTLALLVNDGTPQQPHFVLTDAQSTSLFNGAAVDVGQNSTPAFVDFDADGDLDLVVGETVGTLNFFRNTGTAAQPRFELEDENLGGIDAGARIAPTFHDVNGDGLPDLVVGTGEDGVFVYRNTGTAQEPSFALDGPFDVMGTVPRFATPVFADLDADGDADFFMGGISGGLFYYRNDAIVTAAEAAPPPLPDASVSLSNYPNPFRDVTTFYVRLRQAGRVRLLVYDVQGRVAAIPFDGVMPAGASSIPFDARALPAGMYFYRLLAADGGTATGKMLRVK